jgi:hemoglobin/transferrin/lactoferrin receptor protein
MFDLWELDTPITWPTEFSRDTLTLSYVGNLGETTELRVSAFSNESELWRDERAWGMDDPYSGYVTGSATNEGMTSIAETTLSFGKMEHELTYGLDYLTYTTEYVHDAIYVDDGGSKSGEESTAIALFLQDKIGITDSLFITTGVRYDSNDLDSVMVDNEFSEVTFALAGEYFITEDLVVKLSTTQLFKSPEISEVFTGAGLGSVENQDIKAETGLNSEFAVAYQTEISSGVKLRTGITLFKSSIENYIYDYATVDWTPDNIGDMNIDGSEFYLGVNADALSANITYSLAESDLDSKVGYENFEGARLDRQQGDTVSGNVSYRLADYGLHLNWEVQNVASVENALDIDGASLDKSKDGYTIHNVSARWNPSSLDALTLIVGVDNLLDEYYSSQSSRTGVSFHPRFGNLALTDYEPGRNIKATISYTF